jgi:Zn-dependent peptidase ImmA (M78 family)
MKIPKSILILGQKISVYQVKDLKDKDGTRVDGLYNSEKYLIKIDSNLKGRARIHTFMHEYCHAIIDIIGAHNCEISPDLEEIIVDNIGRSIADNFILRMRD